MGNLVMNKAPMVHRAPLPVQSSESDHTLMTSRQPSMTEPIASKHVCFFKSGDAQFNGLPVVINSRTFKTFEALLDSLSKRIPLPFGVRIITTPRGRTAIHSLDQLHHGQSYICSDKRTVKPIDLERACHKPLPWYHARPFNRRNLAWQSQSRHQAQRPAPRGTRGAKWRQHAPLLQAPRRLVVFRNGNPEVKHTLLLQKRTTHSFEALLDHISEVMCFPVLKLYTPDGRRLDGLSALIMCSGVVVASGREPFSKGDYDAQKPSAPTWLPAKHVGTHPMLWKNKFMTRSTKAPISLSSEHYIMSQTHKSFAGSCDCPSSPPASVERKMDHPTESVAETDTVACLECDGEENIQVPTDEDIEKSFRVNQDGSMTVEMKVHLTIKEEETIQWTTTLSRSSITSQMQCISESPDLGVPVDVDTVPSDIIQTFPNDQSDVSNKDSSIRHEVLEVGRIGTSTLGWYQLQQKQLSVGTAMKHTETESKEIALGSYGYREEANNGEKKEECCVLEQCISHPVPKPCTGLTNELNTFTSQQKSSFYNPAEILQDGGEIFHETTVHVYEQQVCQENFFANKHLCVQDMCTCGSAMDHAETSDTIFPEMSNKTISFCNDKLESELWTSTTYETLHRQENLHTTYNKNIPQEIINTESRTCSPITEFVKPSASRNPSTADTNKRRKPVRVLVKKNHMFQTSASERKRKNNETDILKEIRKIRADISRHAETIRLPEYCRAKAAKKLIKMRNYYVNGYENIPSVLPNTVQLNAQSPNELPAEEELCTNEKNPVQANLSSGKLNKGSASPKKDLLHEEHDLYQETQELSECICLPALHSSPSVFNEYVELWLQKNEPHPGQEQLPLTKTKPSPKVLFITTETVGAGEAAKEDLSCCVLMDNTLSSRSLFSKNKSSEQNVLLNDNSSEKNGIKTALPENVCTEKVSFTSNATSENNSASRESLELSELSKTQGTDKSLEKTSTGNGHIKLLPFPRDSSSENIPLSHPFIDLIPQNNTLLKASRFSHQTEGKKIFNRKKTSAKKSDVLHSTSNKGLACKRTLLDKSQVSSDLNGKSNGNQQSFSSQGVTGTCEINKCPSLRTLSDAEMIEKPVQMAVKRDMKHVLEELCHYIQTLCEVTQQKWLMLHSAKHSDCLPDFSSHMGNTFGSSSQTLKLMAAIEDAEQLTGSLNALQNVACVQLLDSWISFWELNYRSQSHSVITDSLRSGSHSGFGFEEEVIQGLMEELGIPDRVRQELANFCTQELKSKRGNQVEVSEEVNESFSEIKLNRVLAQLLGDETIRFPHSVFEEEVNTYVKSVIEKAIKTHLEESGSLALSMAQLLACTQKEIKMLTKEQERNICYIETTEQGNCVRASDICKDMPSHKHMLEVKRETVDATHKGDQGLDEKEYVLEKNTEYPNTIDYIEKKETVEKVMDAIKKDNDRITGKESTSSSEVKLTASEEDKFSLGEHILGNRFDEEVISFSEVQVNKEEKRQLNAATVTDMDQKDPMQKPLGKLQNEDHKNESQSETYCVKHSGPSGMPATLFATHVNSDMEDKIKHEAEQEQVIYKSKIVYSEEKQVVSEAPECFLIHQEHFVEQSEYDPDEAVEGCEENIGHFTGKKKNSNSVAELISNLELAAQRVSYIPVKTFLAHTEIPEVSKTHDLTNVYHLFNETDRIEGFKSASSKAQTHGRKYSEKHGNRISPNHSLNVVRTTKHSHLDITSELPSSSLAFSYDSPSNSLAQEPERSSHVNRVKSIREMFLTKSNSRKQNVKRFSPSSNSDLSDCNPESTDSGGNHSQTSPEAYSSEDDNSRLAIAKGFVRKTIERLYGRSNSDGTTDVKRPVSASKGKYTCPGRTHVNSLTSFHEACTRGVTDLSYFNATSSFDAFNEQTHCVRPYSQVKPGDAILTDKGHWLPFENHSIHETSPELQETPPQKMKLTTISIKPDQDTVKENVPYSLFCPASPHRSLPSTELEELSGSSGSKFTYFNFPHSNDSELDLEERKSDHSEKTEIKVTPVTQSLKSWETLNSFLPAFRPPVVKKADNKVHPLTEAVTPPVVIQPVRGQSAHTEITRHSTESDLLEMLFIFCGRHCPVL